MKVSSGFFAVKLWFCAKHRLISWTVRGERSERRFH